MHKQCAHIRLYTGSRSLDCDITSIPMLAYTFLCCAGVVVFTCVFLQVICRTDVVPNSDLGCGIDSSTPHGRFRQVYKVQLQCLWCIPSILIVLSKDAFYTENES